MSAWDESFFAPSPFLRRLARRRAVDIEFVGGPKDGERVLIHARWTVGTNVAFRVAPVREVLHYYQVQEKASGAPYFMYVGPAKEK